MWVKSMRCSAYAAEFVCMHIHTVSWALFILRYKTQWQHVTPLMNVSINIHLFHYVICFCIRNILHLVFGFLQKIKWHQCAWWRHQMETFPAFLAICAGNSPVPGEFHTQRPVTQSFDVFFDLCLNKRLRKQWRGWWFETLSRPLWRHSNDKCHWEWWSFKTNHANTQHINT